MSKFKLIIIDDEKPIRNFLRGMIAGHYPEIVVSGEAVDGIEGLDLCRRVRPEIVLTDIRMPGINGIALLEKIAVEQPNTRVILISGYDEFEYAQNAVKHRATDYLLKPVDEKELHTILLKTIRELKQQQSSQRSINDLKRELKKLLDDLSGEAVEEGSCPISHVENTAIRKALIFIHRNYHSGLTLQIVAEKVFLSTEYFSKLFKKEVGTGFQVYITGLRNEKAKVLLDNSQLKVSEIAHMLGYTDTSHFTKVFRNQNGFTPTEYRNRD